MTDITESPEKRRYRQDRRATQTAETRQRIVVAAVDLHSSLGPARTTLSMIAERAGVQRHTLYAHFPEERDLFLACSGLFIERDPPPDPAPWREIDKPRKRLKVGLAAIYAWYARNAAALAAVLRDAEFHDLTRETVALRHGPHMVACHDILGAGLDQRQQTLLHLALGFPSWRSLVGESGLTSDAAADMMTDCVFAT